MAKPYGKPMAKFNLSFSVPLMNAAGMLGFAPDVRRLPGFQLGAFVTNPVSHAPRTPAHGMRYKSFVGGFLLHTGYPNPGLSTVLQRCARRWARSTIPVIVHLLGQEPDDLAAMARRLETVPGVMGLELGFPKQVRRDLVQAFVLAASSGELPVIARLPLDQAAELAASALQAGAAAVSLGAPRGALPLSDGGIVQGRLYGPALFPQALVAIQALVQTGTPVIGAGGVYTPQQVQAMRSAGAMAVQLDAVIWRQSFQL
jgi:dihydroorotate dehydrogenase (NAD+) catalytic subunit